MVLRGGAYVGGGEEVDGDVEGGECLCQGGTFGELGGGAAWGDEGRRGGYCEGVGARWRKAECAQGHRRKAWRYALLMAV